MSDGSNLYVLDEWDIIGVQNGKENFKKSWARKKNVEAQNMEKQVWLFYTKKNYC